MITFTNLDNIIDINQTLEKFKSDCPTLFEKLVGMVHLTRALQLRYHYLGCLIMDEDSSEFAPKFVDDSVLRLYKKELRKIKMDGDFGVLKQLFKDHETAGYEKICQLVLGITPESLVGASGTR